MYPKKKEDVLFGISPKGIHLGLYDNRFSHDAYEEFFPFPSISAWGISSNAISFYLDTQPSQTHYSFALQYAQDAFTIIEHYSN